MIVSGSRGKDGWCLCEFLMQDANIFEPRWEELKKDANDAMARGDAGAPREYATAVRLYSRALSVTLQPMPQLQGLLKAANDGHEESVKFAPALNLKR